MMRPVAAIAAALSCAIVFSASAAPDGSLEGLERYFRQRLEKTPILGGSLAFVHDGRTRLSVTAGVADRERHHAVDADTIYHWASITKTFTAIGIMQLRDRGRLSLDDPVVKYIPELAEVHNPFGNISQVTIRRLMCHSAGFRNATWPWGGDKAWHPFEPKHWSQLVAMLPYTEIEFEPGSRYSYSNPGIIFLGRIIELLSGDDYEVYIDKNIFRPLGMSRSYFDTTPYYLLSHRSASYFVTTSGVTGAAPFDADTGITVSNGGLNAPVGDMVKYLNFLLGVGGDRALYDLVLARPSLEEMFVPQIAAGTEGADRVSLGLNFFVEDRGGYRLVGHSGTQNGFISHFYVCPAVRAGYLAVFNTEWEAANPSEADNRTRQLDTDLRTYILQNVFPALKRQEAAPGR
jgi:CubicO group peptidase (beta-lactamase class C family)